LFEWDVALPFPVLLGVVVASTIKFLVEPRQLSRFYALADRGAARAGLVTSTACFLVVFSMLAPIGLLAHRLGGVLGEVRDTDEIVPALLASGELFGPLTTAFLMLAMLSAAMSSLDSVLLVVATTFERDVVDLARGHQSDRVGAARLYVMVFAMVTALVALRPPAGIVELTSFSGSLYGACFLPAVALGLWWRRGDGASVLASFLVGILVLLSWRWSPLRGVLHEVFPAMLASLAAYVAVALRPSARIVAATRTTT
jgi:Na+/pantothenate symporter